MVRGVDAVMVRGVDAVMVRGVDAVMVRGVDVHAYTFIQTYASDLMQDDCAHVKSGQHETQSRWLYAQVRDEYGLWCTFTYMKTYLC
jgi:hypothetical protein